jgi:hypothetical protein
MENGVVKVKYVNGEVEEFECWEVENKECEYVLMFQHPPTEENVVFEYVKIPKKNVLYFHWRKEMKTNRLISGREEK